MLSVVIAHRNEAMLEFTVSRIRETTKVPTEIVVVDDASTDPVRLGGSEVVCLRNERPLGVGPSRDRGIAYASYDSCLILDAHMNFWPDDWSKKLAGYNRIYRQDIACAKSLGLSADRMAMEDARGCYWGAHLHPEMCDAQGGRRRVLGSRWNRRRTAGTIGSVLGAAYLISKHHYMNTLRRPWGQLRGWGSSEQVISLLNYMLGYRCTLLDVEIGHMYRDGRKTKAPYVTDLWKIFYNQLVLLELFVDQKDRPRLMAWLEQNHQGALAQARAQLQQSGIGELAEYIHSKARRSWAEYRSQWMRADCVY